jgi:hypothetical protein
VPGYGFVMKLDGVSMSDATAHAAASAAKHRGASHDVGDPEQAFRTYMVKFRAPTAASLDAIVQEFRNAVGTRAIFSEGKLD